MASATESQPTSESTPTTGPAPRKKPIVFKIGIGFMILCGLLYLSILVTLFLPLDAGLKAAAIGGTVAVAEGAFLVGVACVGKETYRAFKARFTKKRNRPATATDTDSAS